VSNHSIPLQSIFFFNSTKNVMLLLRIAMFFNPNSEGFNMLAKEVSRGIQIIITKPLMIMKNQRQHCFFFIIVINTPNSFRRAKLKFSISLYTNDNCKIRLYIRIIYGKFVVASYYTMSFDSHLQLISMQCC
jgi:hypothetical protein